MKKVRLTGRVVEFSYNHNYFVLESFDGHRRTVHFEPKEFTSLEHEAYYHRYLKQRGRVDGRPIIDVCCVDSGTSLRLDMEEDSYLSSLKKPY